MPVMLLQRLKLMVLKLFWLEKVLSAKKSELPDKLDLSLVHF